MKKSLLALAVLGAFAGAAVAQSSVTIYGSLDLGIAKSNGGTSGSTSGSSGATAGASSFNAATQRYVAGPQARAWTVQSGNTPRLGFRGNEDLGGGMSAQFQIEHRFNVDTGNLNTADIFWQGRSYLQLTHDAAGSVYLGRDYGPAFWLAVKSDPFGFDGVGQLGALMYAGFRDPNPLGGAGQVRTSNTVGYKSPSFGGLRVQVATALGEAVVGRTDGFNLEYGAGPIYAAFAFERVRGGGVLSAGNVGSRDGDKLMSFALHYDLGVVKPMFYFARAEVDATGRENDFWSLGALAPIGPGRLKAVYAQFDDPLPVAEGREGQKASLGYDYPLSKRTNLYADVGVTKIDTATRNTTWSFGAKHTF